MYVFYHPISRIGKTYGFFVLFSLFLTACAPEAASPAQQAKTPVRASSPPPVESQSPAPSRELLEKCLFEKACLIAELPPLGLEYQELDETAPIMARVWSSSPWMRERFEQLLQELPAGYLQLFRPVTAIAVAEDIRPSHYWPATGGIYIDPSFLWFTQEEKRTINGAGDRRTLHTDDFPFQVRWRYVDRNNTDPFIYHSLDWKENRTLKQVSMPFAVMMTHELAHANDYLPPHAYELLPYDDTFYDAVFYGINTYLPHLRISTTLQERFPLNNELVEIARSYYGNGSTAHTKTAVEVSNLFVADAASSFYGYTNQQEDLAMLFEEVMIKEFFALERDMAFTKLLHRENHSCNDYQVQWGVRNRFAHPNVRERAEFSVNQLFPEYDFTSLFEEVYAHTYLAADLGWCQSINGYDTEAISGPDEIPFSDNPSYDLFEYHSENSQSRFIPR